MCMVAMGRVLVPETTQRIWEDYKTGVQMMYERCRKLQTHKRFLKQYLHSKLRFLSTYKLTNVFSCPEVFLDELID